MPTRSPTAVRIVLRDDDGRLLMLKRAADDELAPGLWELPGGGIDPGETPRQAAARELREEAGLRVSERALESWGEFARTVGARTYRTAVFAIMCDPRACAPALSHEHDDWCWASGRDGLDGLTPSAAWATARIWPGHDIR